MSSSSSVVVQVVVPRRTNELELESSVGLVAEETPDDIRETIDAISSHNRIR